MPLLKFALCVGVALSALLYGWSEYLEPAASKVRTDPPPARNAEVFRPTPAPPIADLETPPPAEEAAMQVANEKPANVTTLATVAKVPRAKVRKHKVHVARRPPAPQDSLAYFRSPPFFFGWR
jgi:hypothetical protein